MSDTEKLPYVTGAHILAWQRVLRLSTVAQRELDADLQAMHGMTISDYDVLVQLRDAGGTGLRMSDVAERTLLTRSGITRLIQGLERDGLVQRRPSTTDARATLVELSPLGLARLAEARSTHHDGIRRHFANHLSEDAADELAQLLAEVPAAALPTT